MLNKRLLSYLKILLFYGVSIVSFLLIVSIIYYFEIVNYKVLYIISYVFMLILHLLVGFKVSRFERKKGYLNGFISGVVFTLVYLLISLILKDNTTSSYIYYLTLILSSIVGGISGVPNEKR